MNSGNLKTYKYVKVSKSNFFTITIFSYSICSKSKNEKIVQHLNNLDDIMSKIKTITKGLIYQILSSRVSELENSLDDCLESTSPNNHPAGHLISGLTR